MDYEYYYNNVPGVGLTRNNLIYTSLISRDKKTFVQWYHNDSEYHKGNNEVVDSNLMNAKWNREVKYLIEMARKYEDKVPKILEINHKEQKIYLSIDGLDFWNRAGCVTENYDKVLPDWKDQMCKIITAHKSLGLHKYSMHPSSYFVVNGQLKSINYFFTYHEEEPNISIKDVESHIHSNRQAEMRKHLKTLNIEWHTPQPWKIMDQLCWESFRTNYPQDFIESVKECIK
jgi:hypothetical protein